MNPKRRRRLVFVVVIVCGMSLAVGFALYALRQNINLFYTPTQVINGLAPTGQHIRLGGMVERGSIHHAPKSLKVTFVLQDLKQAIQVAYTGILPDLFRAGQRIVVEGRLNGKGEFIADRVLAKHDENYMPPQVRDALAKQKHSEHVL